MRKLIQFTLATLGLLVSTQVQAEDVILRLAPSDDGQIIGKVDSSDPVVLEAAPVLDSAQAADGWKWSEYTTSAEGYIPESALGKNFTVTPSTFVRAAPNSSASILTTSIADDTFEYVSTNGQWAQVRFTKAVPVYFQTVSRATVAAAVSTRDGISVTYDSEPTEVSEPSVPEIEQPVVEDPPRESIVVTETEQPVATTPRRPEQPKQGVPTRILTGKLVRENTNYGPRYPMRLLSSSGNQLAYVDMSQIFINDLRPYLNQPVFIRGEVRPLIPGGKALVIIARTIQLAPQ